MIGYSNDETNFPHELILTDRQVSRHLLKLSKKTIIQDDRIRRFLGKLLLPLMEIGFSFMKNGLTPQAKSVLMPLRNNESSISI